MWDVGFVFGGILLVEGIFKRTVGFYVLCFGLFVFGVFLSV
jgi:hypothetical protein